MSTINIDIQQRRDIAANWTSNNPTLLVGEWGVETDTGKVKMGDGSTAWAGLNYFETGGGVIDHGALTGLDDDDHSAIYHALSDFISSSAGAGDSGKPIKLDAGGKVDATMIEDSDIDHNNLTNTHNLTTDIVIPGGVTGNLVGIDASDNLEDSGKAKSDIHTAASVGGAPLTLSAQEITFNYDANDFQLDGNNLQIKSGGSQLNDLSDVNTSTPTNKNVLSADGVDWESKTLDNADIVDKTNIQTINGVKTFGSFPVTPSSAPSSDYQVANKKYVDDNGGGGGPTLFTGQDASMEQNDVLTISHDSETSYTRSYDFYREVAGVDTDWSTLDFDLVDEANYSQGDYKQTAAKFQVDTADVTGHFEDSGNSPVTVGSGNTCPYIQVGVRFKLSGDAQIYEIDEVTGDGEADNEIGFVKQDGTAATKATGTYDVEWVRGTEFSGGVVQLNETGSGYGSDVLTGGTPTASTAHASYPVGNGCDDNTGTLWSSLSATNEWWKYDFGAGITKKVRKLRICQSLSGGYGSTKNWTLYGSNNDSDWTSITSGQVGETPSTWYEFTFANATAYRYYRISIDDIWASLTQYIAFAEAEMMEYSLAYAINQVYVTCTTDSNQADCSDWADVNSSTVTETLNTEKIYYAISFDGRTTWGIFDDTVGDVGWRPIARNNAGTWQHNSNVTPGANDVTWTNSTIDSQEGALSQAMGVAQNQMSATEMDAISDANWNNQDGAMAGWSTSVNYINFGGGLISTSASATPELSQITVNYLAPTYWEPVVVGDDWDIQCFSTKTKLIKLGTGTDNVKGSVRLYS